MATYKAYALSTDFLGSDRLPGGSDHTYVVCGGTRWGCKGRSRGGRRIAKGTGIERLGICLGKLNSGIRPPANGVCHQAANRILFAAGKAVLRANGYAASVALFGTYGIDALLWRSGQRRTCQLATVSPVPPIPIPPIPLPPFPTPWSLLPPGSDLAEFSSLDTDMKSEQESELPLDTDDLDSPETEQELRYLSNVASLYGDSELAPAELISEDLRLLLEYRLAEPCDQRKLDDLRNVQANAQNDLIRISGAYDTGEVSATSCSKHARAVGDEAMIQFAGLLGDHVFESVFEMSATDAAELISLTPYVSKSHNG